MGLRRWIPTLAMLAATCVGMLAGLALVLLTSPVPTFAYHRVSIIAWRGDDNVPANVEMTGWSAPMFYPTPEEGAQPGPPAGRRPTGVWAPGDMEQRLLTLKNLDPDRMMRLVRLKARLTGAADLAPWFALTVTGPAGEPLYSGTLADLSAGWLTLQHPVVLNRGGRVNLTFAVALDRNTPQALQGRTVRAAFELMAEPYSRPMVIDIHPWSWPNPINPRSKGVVPVAVNGGPALDVTRLDGQTARFGPHQAVPNTKAAFEDWNRDGYMDMILHFRTQDTGIVCGMPSASLRIAAPSGEVYEGADAIVTPGCR